VEKGALGISFYRSLKESNRSVKITIKGMKPGKREKIHRP